MAKKNLNTKTVETLTHDSDKRKNIPTAEFQAVVQKEQEAPKSLKYPRNTDLDPQLVWRGKDDQDWSDLVVQAPPLYIQEKVHPKVLIEDLLAQTRAEKSRAPGFQLDLFSDFNGIPKEADKTEFYQHDQNWSNRMILGDSLQVMASLAEREGLRGKVQCIYIDPPYGIKFNSNFQWSTTSRDVKDGKADQITREPEQVKAFRDTWRDGIHSYLTYLRDRLTVARDLLTESGSIFVQIGDENVARVRSLMDEVFGENNFVTLIAYAKTTGFSGTYLSSVCDYLIWYSKSASGLKYRALFDTKEAGEEGASKYKPASTIGALKNSPFELTRLATSADLTSQGASVNSEQSFSFRNADWTPPAGLHWKTTISGLARVAKSERVIHEGKSIRYVRFLDDFSIYPRTNVWLDVGGVQSRTDPKIYVVQTATEAIKRCILMATDPGDLVLDPTCGAGTTAFVAEQWGRRWITIDTSRVALALARARLMGARYPFYLLADSREGQQKEGEVTRTAPSTKPVAGNIRHGFVYERVPHITLKSIANNAEIDVIWEKWQTKLEPLRKQLSVACGQGPGKALEEWQIPREPSPNWPPATQPRVTAFWEAKIARQKEIDASIAAKAEFEYLYDKPYEDKKKVRVAGPFTVESLSPHRMLGVDENDELIDPAVSRVAGPSAEYRAKQSFPQMILENLKIAGVQQAHKENRITFTTLVPWPGDLVCAEGRFASDQWSVISDQSPAAGNGSPVTEKRAAIFIGPEFGTVQRADLVSAAREAGDADFDVLIACAFNYEAHTTEFNKLGRIPVLKARMNADLHMSEDLKNTGKGNLFVVFGEPDITVTSGQWLVSSNGRMVVNYDCVKELSGLGSLEEINRSGRNGLSALCEVSGGRKVRDEKSDQKSDGISLSEHRGGGGTRRNAGVSPVSGDRERVSGGDGNISHSGGKIGNDSESGPKSPSGTNGDRRSNAQRAQTLATLQSLRNEDFPLSLTTGYWSQVTVHGVDVFKPQTGEVISSGAGEIACWFIDIDYNEESFFVRHAYFLGANDPYSALKTTLKAEINAEAWETLKSDTSRPFEKPKNGRVAVKIINHLGDEVMKVFRVDGEKR